MHNQAIVNLFGGHQPLCLSFDSTQGQTIYNLKERIHDVTRVDIVDQRISSMGGRPLTDDHVMFNEDSTVIFNLSLGLLGGKGGFGSMLRAQGGRMNAQKTTNFEACRDLQGRRIRTVNETKKLQEELDALPEREKEKRERLQKKIEEGLKGVEQKKYRFDDTQFLEDREQMVESVKNAVGSLLKQQKKKKVAAVSVSMFDDDDDEEDDDDDELVDADNEEPPTKKQKQEESSSTTVKKDKGKGKATASSTEKATGEAAGSESDDDEEDSKKVLSEFLETNYDEYDSEDDEDFEEGDESSEEEEELEEDFEAEEEDEDDTPKAAAGSSSSKGKGKQTGKRKQRDE
ncbi:telomere stability and silencing-domain-containing protein [Fennellomyces sp. T-0311]|nr:telomere stability and silencing-domain-containing protein [Fennellomyces sp. T-0311]